MAALVAASALSSTPALAQNADPFFHGDDAALSAGAVVASSRDSGSFWYNPAGFGGLKRGLVSGSASTFGLRIRPVLNALRLRLGRTTDTDDLVSFDVIGVPNAVVAAAKLSDRFSIAGGLLTTSRDVRAAFTDTTARSRTTLAGERLDVDHRLDLQRDTAWYNFGVALAAELAPGVRAGVSLYGGYVKFSDSFTYLVDARSPIERPLGRTFYSFTDRRVTTTAITALGAAGLQYEVSDRVRMGATLRAPEVLLSTSSEGGAILGVSSSTGQSDYTRTSGGPSASGGVVVNPARLLLGSAFALGRHRSWLEVGMDVAHGLPASQLLPAKRAVINGRIGVRYALTPTVILGGGFFTDRSPFREVGPTFGVTDRVNWYGLTSGVSKRIQLALPNSSAPDGVVLVMTGSLRAAVGVGEARTFDVDLNAGDTAPTSRSVSSVAFWEVMPYIGSSVVF